MKVFILKFQEYIGVPILLFYQVDSMNYINKIKTSTVTYE